MRDWTVARFIAVWLVVGWLAGACMFALFGEPVVIAVH
jgi:hypothetical protein